MKKLISLLLVAVMVLSFGLVNASAEEPVTIICYTNDNANNAPTDLKDDFVYQTILARTGVDFRVVYLDEYDTSLAARLMGGDDWHMFLCDADQMRTYAAQDMLLPLSSYTDMLNTIYGSYGEDTNISALYYDGEMYAIPAAKAISDYYLMLLVRNDWNKKYPDLKVPTTVDELYDYCHFLANNDPDGNGIKDTIGFTGYGLQALDAIANAYDAGLGNYVIVRDNKVTSSLLQPGMKDALTMIRKFFEAGLVDPDILGAKSEIKAHTLSGNFGVSVMKWSDISKAAYLTQAHEINPDLVYGWCGPMASEIEGAESVYGILDYNRNTRDKYVINANVSEEKLEAIFKVLQYLCTDEGSMMVYVGLEGDHWQRNADNSITMTERGKTETLYAYKYQILGREEAAYLALKFPEAADVVAYCLNTPRYIIYNKSVEIPADFYLSDLENYVNMQLIAFVKGERPVAEYDQFIDELYKTYDFQRYLDICAEQLVALGYAAK